MTIVFKVSDNIKPLMMEFYKDRMLDKKPPYSVFQVKEYDCVITLYESGKVMFQGIGADIEASYWIEELMKVPSVLMKLVLETSLDQLLLQQPMFLKKTFLF